MLDIILNLISILDGYIYTEEYKKISFNHNIIAFCHFYGNISIWNNCGINFYRKFSHQLIDLLNISLIFANLNRYYALLVCHSEHAVKKSP